MISVEEATRRVLALAIPMPPEVRELKDALGRHMLAPAYADLSQPPFDASSMDGYALGSMATVGARYDLRVGEASAGHRFDGTLSRHEAVRIFTGAPVPNGVARVVLQEDVTLQDGQILIGDTLDLGPHIRPCGQDFVKGQSFAPKWLSANDLALLAAMNVPKITLAQRPKVAIIATGDELVMPGERPNSDQIIASNIFALKALAEAAGATARILPIARDTAADLQAVLELALTADVIVTIGGASVGDHDLVKTVAEEMGLDRAFYKIAMRPGKPLMAGRIQGRTLLGLPGNPVSAIVCAHLFLVPLLRAMQGDQSPTPKPKFALLAHEQPKNGPRAHYMRATIIHEGATAIAHIAADQDSALLSVLTGANALVIAPSNCPALPANSLVPYLSL